MLCNRRYHDFEGVFDRMLGMASDEQLYRAYTFNVAGFALMTPFGKLVLDVLSIYRQFEFNIFSIGYIVFCCGLVIAGFRSIAHGRDILDI